jgi:hypothetical protein
MGFVGFAATKASADNNKWYGYNWVLRERQHLIEYFVQRI